MSLFGSIADLLSGSRPAPRPVSPTDATAAPFETSAFSTPDTLDAPDSDTGGETGDIGHAVRIGARWFLLPAELPAEVAPALNCVRMPFTRPWCLGLANFRGEPIPVYDLNAALATGETSQDKGRYSLVLGSRDQRGALHIDAVRLLRIPPESSFDPAPALPNLPDDFSCHSSLIEGITYIRIDFSALLSSLAARASLLTDGTSPPKDQP